MAENAPTRVHFGTDWALMEEQYLTKGAQVLDLRLLGPTHMRQGDTLWFDDVRLKRVATGDCSW